MRKFMSKLMDVFLALIFIVIITLAQYLATDDPSDLMLTSKTDHIPEAEKMVCPIKGGCDSLDQVAQSK